MRRIAKAMLISGACAAFMTSCEIGYLIGGMAQNAEYQTLLEVEPQYDGLENKTVAVVVNADMATLYEHPVLSRQLAGGLAVRIQQSVPGVRVMSPDAVLAWQFNTTGWSAMPYGDIAATLNVDRVVFVDLYEYRLHPPGDRWMWEGVCAASIGVIERESIDPDFFAKDMSVTTTFPDIETVTRDEMTQQQMEFGLVQRFIRDTTWLFHTHLEPKYPDKYQGSLPDQPAP